MAYPDVQSQPKFPAIEEAVSAFWAADQTFEASVQLRSAGEKGNSFSMTDLLLPTDYRTTDTCLLVL